MSYHFHRILSKNNSKSIFDWKLEEVAIKDIGSCIATDYAAKLARFEENKEIILTGESFDFAFLVKSDGSYNSIYNKRCF